MVQLQETHLSPAPDIRSWPARARIIAGGNLLLMMDVTRVAWAFRKAGQRFQPAMLLDAFLDQLGENGTLVIPTFNYDLQDGESFDLLQTPTISGAFGQAALQHPSFKRTAHPLHSFAVAGKLQDEFLAANDRSSFGPRSPFALLKQHAFQLMAIDMPLEPAFTYVHFVEETLKVHYRRKKQVKINYTDRDGRRGDRVFELYAKRPGFVNDFKALEPLLRSQGILAEQQIDGSELLKIDLAKAHDLIENDIRKNGARSIVQYKLKWWIRDLMRPLIRGMRPSRSAMISGQNAAGTHR